MGKVIDLRGQRFGRLFVPNNAKHVYKNNATYWPVICDCGNTKLVNGYSLRAGRTKSCGCLWKEEISKTNTRDLTGQTFGRLIVLFRNGSTKEGKDIWHCKCTCGNECDVIGTSLTKQYTQSCGCLSLEAKKNNVIDLTGKTFDRLTVVYRTGTDKNGQATWMCSCICGNKIEVAGTLLINKKIRSCGCMRSRGNAEIEKILINNNIEFHKESQIKSDNKIYRYDFAIINKENQIIRLIEFDGEQHYPGVFSGGWNTEESFIKRKESDKVKNEWAASHNIPLVRIPYWERDNVTLDMIFGDQYLVNN